LVDKERAVGRTRINRSPSLRALMGSLLLSPLPHRRSYSTEHNTRNLLTTAKLQSAYRVVEKMELLFSPDRQIVPTRSRHVVLFINIEVVILYSPGDCVY